ncbi:hypothetical protein SAMN04488542_11717 [Fontibacillus panacisegetis]|uniref:J domain-containing protein n=1 Tax=Fontibacillus panacisegetis TaxID=670482 RepID=A0A1G7NW53_9BACL|nr:molecular chaperone DnaJ [Fontibacillus panacisegetis]SDF78275.1 hypothetical protein SAMN04488542_11717 [Fontibacillus panacisegetis]
MDELKKAYELLGLPENASREEVEKAFDIELRKSRSRQNTNSTEASGESEFDQKLKAYKLITGHEDRQKIETMSRERFEKWGKHAGTAQKLDDFFRIYKSRVIIGVLAAIILIVGLTTYLNHREEQQRLASLPPIDLSMMFIGNFTSDPKYENEEALGFAMAEPFPEWSRFETTITYLPSKTENMTSADLAYQQKAMALLSTEEPDIYILDQASFDWLSDGGILENLDTEYNDQLKTLITNDSDVKKAQTKEDTQPHVYGIRVADTTLAGQLPVAKEDMIISLRIGSSENKNKAIQFIKHFFE